MREEPIARAAYDELADAFSAQIETKAHNAFYAKLMRQPGFICFRAVKNQLAQGTR